MPLKRAAKGQLPLLEAVQAVSAGKEALGLSSEPQSEEARLVRNAKQIALTTIGAASQKYGAQLEMQQEVIMSLSDIFMEILAMESILLRAEKLASSGGGSNAQDICALYMRDAVRRIEDFSRTVLSACADGAGLKKSLARVREYASYEPVNSIALRRQIAARLLSSERYVV
jgi:hypothetical protein